VPIDNIHIAGSANYAKFDLQNNCFLQTITTIPIGNFQQTTFDIPFSTNTTMDIDQTMLHNILCNQPWFMSIEKTIPTNSSSLTTKKQLDATQVWVSNTLPTIYSQNLAGKNDVTIL